jgi:arsenate reductase
MDPESNKGKQTLAYALTFNVVINIVDITKALFTGTQLLHFAALLSVSLEQLADSEKLLYKELMGKAKNFDDDDWITVLTKHPDLIRSPVAMMGTKAIIINTPTDIFQL